MLSVANGGGGTGQGRSSEVSHHYPPVSRGLHYGHRMKHGRLIGWSFESVDSWT